MLLMVRNVLSPEKKDNRPALWGRTSIGESQLLLHDFERGLGGAGALAFLMPQGVCSLGAKLHLQRVALVKKGCHQLIVLKVFLR
eukprot:scaffold49523_cov35-Attheya_sp.AAC.1